MIPSILAEQTRRGVEEFLRTTFPITTPFFSTVLDDLIDRPEGIFKGPFITMRLPYQGGVTGKPFFPDVLPTDFKPYRHQELAFERLETPLPKATIVATGTGSGKTECFMYPVLDHCYRNLHGKGIKAIVIYPMNALATDQAKRFAKEIYYNPNLRGKIRVGMYVGGKDTVPTTVMEAEKVITDRDEMRRNPPDILLTNYRMLDFLLIRPKDAPLWQYNRPETLKYMVVDELHSFDGAQATDLACLIRRLKYRTQVAPGQLCCVGTSATLGGGTSDGRQDLLTFASKVFDESFDEYSIVLEHLKSPEEFFKDAHLEAHGVVEEAQQDQLNPLRYKNKGEYIDEQIRLWFGKELVSAPQRPLALTQKLMQHLLFRNLLQILKNRTVRLSDIQQELIKIVPDFGQASAQYQQNLILCFCALVSEAKIPGHKPDRLAPLLNVRIQLWMRELARMVASVSPTPSLQYSDDLQAHSKTAETGKSHHLPMVHCRDCGLTGWGGLKKEMSDRIETNLKEFYQAFFDFDPVVSFLFPDFEPMGVSQIIKSLLCPRCLTLQSGLSPLDCRECGNEASQLIPVHHHHPRIKKEGGTRLKSSHDCPRCESKSSLTILGSRAASLIGVAIGQIFASNYNDDKKMLTFSDNVQDASHRAAFFQARTYRFNLRGALAKWLNTVQGPVPLNELADGFERYWRAQTHIFPTKESLLATFIPPDMDWFDDYEEMVKTGELPQGSNLYELFQKRLAYELWREFCYDNRIGRTLEKAGNASLGLSMDDWTPWTEQFLTRLHNECGMLNGINLGQLQSFLHGVFHGLKNRGGCMSPFLKAYVESGGNSFLLSQRHLPYMPQTSPYARLPDFLIDGRGDRFTRIRTTGSGAMNWLEAWFYKIFKLNTENRAIYAEAMPILLKEMVRSGMLLESEAKGQSVWGLNPKNCVVVTEVLQASCQRCKHGLSLPSQDQRQWEHTACMQTGCSGRYEILPQRDNYYRELYAHGDVKRLFSKEHTGLLKRDLREALENDFIHGGKPASANLLSCTPTLEMGINIGDLSSLILCSVPPDQSNYIQRVGRAGRTDGNAFVMTVANAHPHDLFFYEDTNEMLEGSVRSPGVFLDASAVLERQFTAFVFDQWVASGGAEIPDELKVVLDKLKKDHLDEKVFPGNYLKYFRSHRAKLKGAFMNLFPDLEEETKARLSSFIEEETKGTLSYNLVEGLFEIQGEKNALKKRVSTLTSKINTMKKLPHKDQAQENELDGYEREKSSLNTIITHNIQDKHVLNFLTDEGLLPNYAFPEAGVTLRSIIWKKRNKKNEGNEVGSYQTTVYEYERPGASAISEFAPSNHFFAEGRRVQINQINLDLSEKEDWRFCDECSHLEKVKSDEVLGPCPKCHSPMWAESAQKKTLLRLKQVIATTSDRDSRSRDDSDNRDSQYYVRDMFVDLKGQAPLKAFQLNAAEVPFGFEYLKSVGLREINFGKISFDQNHKFKVAGKELTTQSFKVCKDCGVVKIGKEVKHDFRCKYKTEDDEGLFQSSFLYREYNSEAIRILLPFSSGLDVQKSLQSFVAALHMGLREYFKGSPGHISSAIYEDPGAEYSAKRRYLVLYDAVPGGSGYLKTLMADPKKFMQVFQLAFTKLERCDCRNNGEKDGCYRCLLAYRGSFTQDRISRSEALDIFRKIVTHKDDLEEVTGLNAIRENVLLESELEKLFIEALRRSKVGEKAIEVKAQIIKGKPGYFIKVDQRGYLVEPQVELGPAQGVEIPCRADFVFYPDKGGRSILPIAVFTDGYTYHADRDSGHLRLGKDTAQRLAILKSGKYRVWSITWRDVDELLNNKKESGQNFFGVASEKFKVMLKTLDASALSKWSQILEKSSLGILVDYLHEPFLEKDDQSKIHWGTFSSLLMMAQLNGGFCSSKALSESITQWMSPGSVSAFPKPTQGDDWIYGGYEPQGRVSAVFHLEKSQAREFSKICGLLQLDDVSDFDKTLFKTQWNGFLRLLNLCQFNEHFVFFSKAGLQSHEYGDMLLRAGPQVLQETALLSQHEWQDLKAWSSDETHALLDRLAQNAPMLPIVGYELTNEAGKVIAEAELAWMEQKLAILTAEQNSLADIFKAQHWTTFSVSQALQNFPEFLNTFQPKP